MGKTGFFNVTYVLRVDEQDIELKAATMTTADLDRLIKETTETTQDAETGVLTMTGDALEIVLDPESLRVTITRICPAADAED